MTKYVAITLVFLFSVTVLISGASGYSDCEVKCLREMAKARPHAEMGIVSLRLPNCCSGGMKNTCEMNSTPTVQIPVCATTSNPMPPPHMVVIGLVSSDAESDQIPAIQIDLRFKAGHVNKTPPIYLRTLSILC
jgi:hypothetical protein